MAPTPKRYVLEEGGEALTIPEWAARAGLHPTTLYCRLAAGESLRTALGPPRPAGGPKGPRPRKPRACAVCGAKPATSSSRSGRCEDCAGLYMRSPPGSIDSTTPYTEDLACQRFVAKHPDGATLDEVGEMLGVTRERVRQIEAKALAHFRRRALIAGLPIEALELLERAS